MKTRITDMLGIEHPIVQAGMSWASSSAALPAAVSNAGGLGEMNAEGRVRMVSRLKDMYRVGGENVAPPEVEEVLHAHPAVHQAQVIGVPDARLGEVTGAFVLLKEGAEASTDELIAWCKARSANFKVRKYLEIVDTFENIGMTGSSKVQKKKLREHALKLWNLAPAKATT